MWTPRPPGPTVRTMRPVGDSERSSGDTGQDLAALGARVLAPSRRGAPRPQMQLQHAFSGRGIWRCGADVGGPQRRRVGGPRARPAGRGGALLWRFMDNSAKETRAPAHVTSACAPSARHPHWRHRKYLRLGPWGRFCRALGWLGRRQNGVYWEGESRGAGSAVIFTSLCRLTTVTYP